MDWTIYTMGSGEFLWQVFNGIAMITHGNADDYTSAIKIAMLLGVIFMLGGSILRANQGVNIGYIVFAIVMFYLLIFPKTMVNIDDLYDGSVRQVANVPVGVAVIGHVTSHVGYGIAGWFDQAFTPPDATSAFTENGYLSGMKVLIGLRTSLLSQGNYATANAIGGADFAQSIVNYIVDCTLVEVELGLRSINEILRQEDLFSAIKYDAGTAATSINTTGAWQGATCAAAHATLEVFYRDAVYPQLLSDVRSALFRPEDAGLANGVDAENAIAAALSQIGQGGLDVQRYVAANMLQPLLAESIAGKYETDQKYSAQIMVQQAIAQRNVQWSAEQDVFMHYFRPIYSFVEGVVYAVTPIMGILIMLGSTGAGLVLKQLLALAWIQLWLPMLSVANMYQYIALSHHIDALIDMGVAGLTSWSGLDLMTSKVATQLAVGGYMAASAPALAGFLVFGSSVALTHLASRIQGSDSINEKYVAPDLASTPPQMQVESPYRGDHHTGLRAAYADVMMPNIMTRADAQSAEQSAERNLRAKQESFDATLNSVSSQVVSHAERAGTNGDLTRSLTSSFMQGEGAQASAAKKWAEGYSSSQTAQEAIVAAATASVAAKGKINKDGIVAAINAATGLKLSGNDVDAAGGNVLKAILKATDADITGGVSGSGTSENRAGHDQRRSLTLDDIRNVGANREMRAQFGEQLAGKLSDSRQESWEGTDRAQLGDTLAASQRELDHAEKSYQATRSISQSIAMGHNMEGRNIGAALVRAGLESEVKARAQRADPQQFSALSGMYRKLVADDRIADAAAGMKVLASTGHYGDVQEFLNGALHSRMDVGDAQGNAPLRGATPTVGADDVRARVQPAVAPAGGVRAANAGLAGAVAAENASAPQAANVQAVPAQDDVVAHHVDGRAAVGGFTRAAQQNLGEAALPTIGAQLMNKNVDVSAAQRMGGMMERASQMNGSLVNYVRAIGAGGIGAVNELARQLSDEIGISEDGGAARESFNQHKLTREGAFGDGMERAGAERWLLHYAKADRSLSDEQRATIADGAFARDMRGTSLRDATPEDRMAMAIGAERASLIAVEGRLSETMDVSQIADAASQNFAAQVEGREAQYRSWAISQAQAAGVKDEAAQAVFAQGYVAGNWGLGTDVVSRMMGGTGDMDDSRAQFVASYAEAYPGANQDELAKLHDVYYEAGAKGSQSHASDTLQLANMYTNALHLRYGVEEGEGQ